MNVTCLPTSCDLRDEGLQLSQARPEKGGPSQSCCPQTAKSSAYRGGSLTPGPGAEGTGGFREAQQGLCICLVT